MNTLRRLLRLRQQLPLALEIVRIVTEGVQDLHEARVRLARKAREGDLDDSIARIRALAKR